MVEGRGTVPNGGQNKIFYKAGFAVFGKIVRMSSNILPAIDWTEDSNWFEAATTTKPIGKPHKSIKTLRWLGRKK